jgi:hypothetical protein
MDYIYHESATDDLKSVRIELHPNPSGEYFDMKFTSDDKVDPLDLESIINMLWGEWFSRLRINPVIDCKVVLIAAGVTYDVVITSVPRISVAGMNPR